MDNSISNRIHQIISEVISHSNGMNTFKEMTVLKALNGILNLITENKYTEAADALVSLYFSDDGSSIFDNLGYTEFSSPIVNLSAVCALRAKRQLT